MFILKWYKLINIYMNMGKCTSLMYIVPLFNNEYIGKKFNKTTIVKYLILVKETHQSSVMCCVCLLGFKNKR